jgi:hypothetical protein
VLAIAHLATCRFSTSGCLIMKTQATDHKWGTGRRTRNDLPTAHRDNQSETLPDDEYGELSYLQIKVFSTCVSTRPENRETIYASSLEHVLSALVELHLSGYDSQHLIRLRRSMPKRAHSHYAKQCLAYGIAFPAHGIFSFWKAQILIIGSVRIKSKSKKTLRACDPNETDSPHLLGT